MSFASCGVTPNASNGILGTVSGLLISLSTIPGRLVELPTLNKPESSLVKLVDLPRNEVIELVDGWRPMGSLAFQSS